MSKRHDTIARDSNVDILLHDASRAYDGAQFAKMMNDAPNEKSLMDKAKRLLAKAMSEDPQQRADAWAECRRTSDFLLKMGH